MAGNLKRGEVRLSLERKHYQRVDCFYLVSRLLSFSLRDFFVQVFSFFFQLAGGFLHSPPPPLLPHSSQGRLHLARFASVGVMAGDVAPLPSSRLKVHLSGRGQGKRGTSCVRVNGNEIQPKIIDE